MPGYSQSKAKQFTLWEEEVKLAAEKPSAFSYKPNEKHVKPNRFPGASIGLGIKSNAKSIITSPGPQDYEVVSRTDNAVVKPCFNVKLNEGHLPLNKTSGENKDELVVKSLLGSGSPGHLGSYLNGFSTSSVFSKGKGEIPPQNNIILANKRAVSNQQYLLMNSTKGSLPDKLGDNGSDGMTGSVTNATKADHES